MATIKVNDTISLKVNIRDAESVYGISAFLVFPVDAIEILKNENNGDFEVNSGDFLGEDAVIVTEYKIDSENRTGVLAINYSLVGDSAEKNGAGLLFTIKARALNAGTHKLAWGAQSEIISFLNRNVTCKFEEVMFDIQNNTDVNVIYLVVEKDSEEASSTSEANAETPAVPSST